VRPSQRPAAEADRHACRAAAVGGRA
jgi:hypothetical protein